MTTKVRLTDFQIASIIEVFEKHFKPSDHIWLFGSRTDSMRRGGDIDLYIETDFNNFDLIFDKKISFLMDLKALIGEQKIDVIIHPRHYCEDERPIVLEARRTGIILK